MKDSLGPHRKPEAEAQLKELIERIEVLMEVPENALAVEKLLQKAAKLVTAPDRVLDLTVIQHYESWTDLDGLVAELTAEPAADQPLSEEEFRTMVTEMREVIRTGKAPNGMRLDRWMDFYHERFQEAGELFEAVFDEGISLEELVAMAFPDRQ